jgi:2-keto-4-pentenoate hydratase/2-oxohepta-3-ene-1,7-dioic acid hydratase in catechol pathway
MKICRFKQAAAERCGLLHGEQIVALDDLASMAGEKYLADALQGGDLRRLLPIDSAAWNALLDIVAEFEANSSSYQSVLVAREDVELLPPLATPSKLLLLAGNYADHIREHGDIAKEREHTFPYVFMKPPTTTLVGDRAAVKIPAVSPDKIDYEVELAVVIGRQAKGVSAGSALDYVAGYTIINDLSDRGFVPNPGRESRPRDKFFDWLHGKWHDGFCPCGPCLVTADEIPDPQQLALQLTVDDGIRQQASTADQVFTVAQVIEFISSWVTLEPGDIISTGTPAGVGNATGQYLAPGQRIVATISGIGSLTTHMIG